MKDIWLIIFSIGIAQGIFLIITLSLIKKRRSLSIRMLIFLLLCIISLLIAEWFKIQFPIEQIPWSFRTGETIPLLVGPFFLIYIQSVVEPDFRFKRRHLLHFFPFVFFVGLFLPFYLQSNEFKIQYIKSLNGVRAPLFLALFNWFKGLHTIVYLIVSWFLVKKSTEKGKKKIKKWFDAKLLKRLIVFQVFALVAIYGIVVLEFVQPTIEMEPDRIASLIITLSFFVFAFTIILFRESLLPRELAVLKKERYLGSSLKPDEKQLIASQLRSILEKDKPYLKADLTLAELAASMKVNTNHLSQVINELFEKNFHQLINEYRIEEVKRNILDHQKTLYGIALESGFNSKSAFNRIFKAVTGMTPSKYKNALKNKSQLSQ